MTQHPQFSFNDDQAGATRLPLADGQLQFYARAFTPHEADEYFARLLATTSWRQDHITIHGRSLPVPRLQAWYADNGAVLNYSGMQVPACVWTTDLLAIKARICALTGHTLNSVLVNCSRDGNDSVGWHRDDEPEWGPDPVIASVSFGVTRDFVLKHTTKALAPVKCALTHGTMLVMGSGVQTKWKHQLPKRKCVTE